MFKDHHHHKAWDSAVRKAHHLSSRRRGCLFGPMSAVAPADDDQTVAKKNTKAPPPTPPPPPASSSSSPSDTSSSSSSKELYHAERLLPNRDFYTGQWSSYLPHGTGKYLWTDGCMYEGDWRRGKTTGRGKFSWPSGATYEGEFKSGFMDGFGTFTGSSADTYRGFWSMNLKHGTGKKCYSNGDYYDGEWRSGLQDGHGRYVWRNGSEYIGNWRHGLLHGRGSLVWANGNRYDGGWEDGSPRGSGSFRWADGSLYVGIWTDEPGDGGQKGVYYPSPSAAAPTARDPQESFAADLHDCKIFPGEDVTILPSQKALGWAATADHPDSLHKQAVWRSSQFSDPGMARPRRRASADSAVSGDQQARRYSVRANTVIGINNSSTSAGGGGGGQRSFDQLCVWESDGDITCDMVDGSTGRVAREGGGSGGGESNRWTSASPPQHRWQAPKETKKEGVTISKGHKNYELMLNLQLGIRHAVGKQQGMGNLSLDLMASAFDPREKIWTRFPPEGTKHTPPHQSSEFRWKDYCPMVFRTLRRLFKVDAADYMISICGNDALRELSSPGKSGSFFYLTNDDRYMIKTMKKAEVKVLLRMLPAYYNHVRAFENTLVTKFFGLHCVILTGAAQKKVRFMIMGNLFCSEYPIHRRFDLKGSSHGRITYKPEEEIDETTTLKDLDLNFIFRLQGSWFQEFNRQVDRDCEFLEQERIMDYSLLVGLHFKDPRETPPNEVMENTKEEAPRLSKADVDRFLLDFTGWSTIGLGINMPARVERTVRTIDTEPQLIGDRTGELYDVVLFFGIIDILQDYDISKKLEHAYKSIQYDPTSISAVDPKQYSKRFRDFIYKIFVEDT